MSLKDRKSDPDILVDMMYNQCTCRFPGDTPVLILYIDISKHIIELFIFIYLQFVLDDNGRYVCLFSY